MRVDLLCSGSKGNSCLIRHEKSQLLIDCGSTKKYLFSSLAGVNASLDDTDGVLITHAHTDHISQIKHVSHLPIYSYCDLKDVSRIQVVPKQEFDIADFHIQVIGLSHDSPNTVGYVIYAGDEKLVYITDTGYLPSSVKPYLTNATHYIFESNHDPATLMGCARPMFVKQRILSDIGHLNNEDASLHLASLINSNTQNIVLAHISQEGNTPDLALSQMVKTFAKKDLSLRGINVFAASQFECYTLPEKSV